MASTQKIEMKNKRYLRIINRRLAEGKEITCEDCNGKGLFGHAIVDHQSNTLKMVCNDCFRKKCRGVLYPVAGTKSTIQ